MSASAPQPRRSFDQAAEVYDHARPGYPARVFDDLGNLGGLRPGARVLEIGCGTGQATPPLARRGYAVVAVELGPRLADLARRKLAGFDVEIATGAFEEWPAPVAGFDAVVAATAWHWLDARVRLARAAAALRPGGALATIATHHVAGGSDEFFVEVQRCYERWDPRTPPGLRLPAADAVAPQADELDHSDQFEAPLFRRYVWQQTYSTAAYVDVLRTYSSHLTLQPAAGERLLACIAELIEARYGGQISKCYLTELRLARRRYFRSRRRT